MSTAELMMIPLSSFVLSRTPMQVERRKERTKAEIAELADTIKRVGLIHAIVARPIGGGATFSSGTLEIVAGEGRYLAAKLAGLAQIQTTIRELTDEEAEEIQLIENLQRKDLHELVEALGYEQLQKRGHSVDEIADKVGKSARTIYTRLQLLKLEPAARDALRKGDLSASTAMLVARCPASIQVKVCKEIVKPEYGEGPMSYREALDHIQRHYMLRLADAPFDAADAQLIQNAGACGSCPKRTGNQPELFGDVKGADVCTDPPCFRAKCARSIEITLERAKADGQPIIRGEAAKKVFPYGTHEARNGYAKLDGSIYVGNKSHKVSTLVGKDAKTELVVVKDLHDSGRELVIEVVPERLVKDALKAKGIKTQSATTSSLNASQRNAQAKQKLESAYRRRLYETIRPKLSQKPSIDVLRQVAAGFWERVWNDAQKLIFPLWGWQLDAGDEAKCKSKPYLRSSLVDALVQEKVATMNEADVLLFLQDCVLAPELVTHTYSDRNGPEQLIETAKRLRIDAKKIRTQVEAEKAAKAPAKKAAKKKAPRKAK